MPYLAEQHELVSCGWSSLSTTNDIATLRRETALAVTIRRQSGGAHVANTVYAGHHDDQLGPIPHVAPAAASAKPSRVPQPSEGTPETP
jgi:hypothetical protein